MGKGHQAIHNRAIQVNLKIDEKMSISRFKAKLKQLRGNFLNTKLAKKSFLILLITVQSNRKFHSLLVGMYNFLENNLCFLKRAQKCLYPLT